jgi:hypothetical protein
MSLFYSKIIHIIRIVHIEIINHLNTHMKISVERFVGNKTWTSAHLSSLLHSPVNHFTLKLQAAWCCWLWHYPVGDHRVASVFLSTQTAEWAHREHKLV